MIWLASFLTLLTLTFFLIAVSEEGQSGVVWLFYGCSIGAVVSWIMWVLS